MLPIEQNPFRVLGIRANASLKEIKGAEVTVKRYIEIGKTPVLKFDLSPPLKQINRTKEGITKAKNQIHHSKDKLIHSLFWFVSSGPIDDIALSKLTESKNTDEALDTFKKGSKNFQLSLKTATCILNHSTLELILYSEAKDEERLLSALRRKFEILSNKDVINHIEDLVTGEKHKINYSEIKEEVYDVVKIVLKKAFPRRKQSKILLSIIPPNSDFKKEIEADIVNEILKKIAVETKKFDTVFDRDSIKSKSSTPQRVPNNKKDLILSAGIAVVENTQTKIKQLLEHLDKDDYKFEKVIDDVFGRANISVIHLSNTEMDYINYKIRLGETSFIKNLNFNVYSKSLLYFKTQIAPYNCEIKNTINTNYDSIVSLCEDINRMKRSFNNSYRSTYPSYLSTEESYFESDEGRYVLFMIIVLFLIFLFVLSLN